MKPCPKCNKMNSAYADTCKFCGYEIKWVPDDGTNHKEPPNFSAEESKFKDSATNEEEPEFKPDKTDLDDIYNQLYIFAFFSHFRQSDFPDNAKRLRDALMRKTIGCP